MKKVLVVDDTKNIRMMLTKALELEGYEVDTAGNGQQAMEMFTTRSYDLAFLDIKLPEVRGTEILRRIRNLGIATPVIIITAYATVKNAVDCTNLGAVAYVQKPFSAEKIKTVLNELDSRPVSPFKSGNNIGKLVSEAQARIQAGAFTEALEALKRALAFDIGTPEVYLLISRAYEGLGKKEDAARFHQLYKSYQS